jgi:hypothetical protein
MPEPFDFEAWSRLARDDPEGFFRARNEAIERYISSRPEHAVQLRELQRQIDGMRAVAGSPLQALRSMASLIEDRMDALCGKLRQLREETDRLRDAAARLP